MATIEDPLVQQSSQTEPGDAPESNPLVKNFASSGQAGPGYKPGAAPGSFGGAPGGKAELAALGGKKRSALDEPDVIDKPCSGRTGAPGSSSAPGVPPGPGGGPGCDPDESDPDDVARQQDRPDRAILVSTAFMWGLERLPFARVQDILVDALDACYRGVARRLVSMDARLETVVGHPFTYCLQTPPGIPGDPGRVDKHQDRPERALLVSSAFLYDMRHLEAAEVRSILMGALDATYNDAGEEELGFFHVYTDGGKAHSANFWVEPDPDHALGYILQGEESIIGV